MKVITVNSSDLTTALVIEGAYIDITSVEKSLTQNIIKLLKRAQNIFSFKELTLVRVPHDTIINKNSNRMKYLYLILLGTAGIYYRNIRRRQTTVQTRCQCLKQGQHNSKRNNC